MYIEQTRLKTGEWVIRAQAMQHKSQNSTLLIREQCPWQLLSNNGGGPSTFQRNEPSHLHCYMTFSEMEQGQGLLISMLILSGLGEMSSSF